MYQDISWMQNTDTPTATAKDMPRHSLHLGRRLQQRPSFGSAGRGSLGRWHLRSCLSPLADGRLRQGGGSWRCWESHGFFAGRRAAMDFLTWGFGPTLGEGKVVQAHNYRPAFLLIRGKSVSSQNFMYWMNNLFSGWFNLNFDMFGSKLKKHLTACLIYLNFPECKSLTVGWLVPTGGPKIMPPQAV